MNTQYNNRKLHTFSISQNTIRNLEYRISILKYKKIESCSESMLGFSYCTMFPRIFPLAISSYKVCIYSGA